MKISAERGAAYKVQQRTQRIIPVKLGPMDPRQIWSALMITIQIETGGGEVFGKWPPQNLHSGSCHIFFDLIW